MADPNYRGYNDPGMAKAFDDLAKVFAPPTPQEILAGAKAQETRQKMQALSDFYKAANDPSYDPRRIDLMGIGAGLFTPTTGFGARDMHDVTQRRGQDLTLQGTKYSADASAGAARYGHDLTYKARTYDTDVTARTSRENNTADNTRAVTTSLLTPVQQGATRFVPPDVASLYKVPETQSGMVELQPGQKAFTPDASGKPGAGGTLQGNPKPLNDSEMKALIIGTMPKEQQEAIAFGATPVETAPDATGTLKPMTRPQVLAGGKPAIDNTHAKQIFNYKAPDGRSGTATLDGTGSPIDATTRQPLPQGTQLQAPSGVQSKDPLGATTANVTEANRKAAQLDVMGRSLDGYETLLKNNPGIVGIPGAVRGAAQNAVSVVEEFSSAFGKLSPMAKLTEDQVKNYAAQIGAVSRDPAIQAARIAEADLAYKWAQMQNPTGEVSRQAFERALDAVTGGTLRNNQSALEAIAAMRQAIERERGGVEALRRGGNPGPAQNGGAQTIQTPHGNVTIQRVQ
jgi:hypothetical protein